MESKRRKIEEKKMHKDFAMESIRGTDVPDFSKKVLFTIPHSWAKYSPFAEFLGNESEEFPYIVIKLPNLK